MSASKIDSQIYQNNFVIIITLVASIFIFALSLLHSFPIEETVKTNIDSALAKNKTCPLTYDDLVINIIPPSAKISDITIPSICSSSLLKDINLRSVDLSFGGIDWILLSPIISFETSLDGSFITGELSTNQKNTTFRLNRSKINLKNLMPYMKSPVRLSGVARVTLLIETIGQKLNNFSINAHSKDLSIGASNISGMEIPAIDIGDFQIRALTPNSQKLVIRDIILGKENADFHGLFKGNITLDSKSLENSKLDIDAQFKIAGELEKQFSFFNLMLAPYKGKNDDYFNLKLAGTLNSPKPQKK